MKRKKPIRPFRFSMRVNLTLFVLLEIGFISLANWGAGWLLNYFGLQLQNWELLVNLGISLVLGSIVTAMASKWIFSPITRLGKAMGQVAKGDFKVRMAQEHRFREIEDIYGNFNLMTQELGNTEILQTDFVSNVSHEFKTPINAIEGYATLLQDCESETLQKQYVEKILSNTQRLSNLVGNILLLSKVDNQAIQSQRTKFRLDEQIRQSVVLLEPKWAEKDIELDVEMQMLTVLGSESLLQHVWNNLIDNAIKFSPPGGLIRISLEKEEDTLIFSVDDQGPGVREEEKEAIFHRFYQSDSSHKQEGNGLGLALVKRITLLEEGSVEVENLKNGCRFTVRLPYRK